MAQTLETIISINAKTGNGFSQVGATLTELGSMVSVISDQLIDFGKDSVEVYRDYEKSMKDAEVALSTTYGRGTKELSSVMSQLDVSATEWAASSIFHTNDVGNAISEAAHAGWDYNQIMAGIPAAMRLAQAGGLDLSESVNYIVKSTNAAGIGFEDMTHFIDLWSFAANSSASTIGEFGDAMLRMGSTMRFAGDTEELMTLIAVTANAGSTGSEAGTLIRNSIMRLISPTQKAEKVMAQLGATSEEASSLMEDQALATANAELAAHGFSAFDEHGELKNTLEIYRELYLALGEIAGGFDNIDKNEGALQALSAIFPTRTITEALTLLRSASEGYDGLYEAMKGGDAEGYGQYAAETMMDSLDGRIETFSSKVERLKQLTGEALSDDVSSVLGTIGDIVDKIAGLDEGTFNAIVSGAEVLAAAGPSLLIAGTAFRLIGQAMTPAGAIGISAIALIAAARAINEIENANFEDKFGNLELDSTEINNYVSAIREEFDAANEQINSFRTALDEAVSSYQSASSELKSNLLTSFVTDSELTADQISNLNNLGEQIIGSVQDGINNNYAANMQSITNVFGGSENADDIDNPVWNQIMSVLEFGYEDSIARAEELGQQLRDAMTSAFQDGHLTSDEIANIQSILDEQNQLMAEQQSIDDYVAQQKILRKAQTLGLDGIQEIVGDIEAERDRELDELYAKQDRDLKTTELSYDKAIENGLMVPNTDGTPGEHVATAEDKEIAMAQARERYEADTRAKTAELNDLILRSMMAGIGGSDLNDTWGALSNLANDFRQAGGIVTQGAANAFNDSVRPKDAEQTSRYLNMMVDALGGYDAILGYENYYRSTGNESQADQYRNIADMYDVLGNGNKVNPEVGTVGAGDYSDTLGTRDQMAAILAGGTSYTPEGMAQYIHDQEALGLQPEWALTLGEDVYSQMLNSAMRAGYDGITDWVQAIEQQPVQMDVEPVMSEDSSAEVDPITTQVIPEIDESTQLSMDPIPVPIEPHMEGEDSVSALQDQGVQVQVDGDTQALQATIDGADGQNLMEYVDGDATNLSISISDQDGKTLVEHVTGNASSLANIIEAYNGRTITVNIAGNRMFAEGGRATEASTFGEAGPEWAIPEEHTQRTADLLNAARAASGFTWEDLLSMYGGLNAGTAAGPTTIIYSPVINAQDATGVEAVLKEDKKRLDEWYENRKLRDEIEVYQ